MYLGGNKTIISYDLFIVKNIRMDHQMDAEEYDGLFYKELSENTLKNKIINIKINEDDLTDWTIYIYLSHHFGLKLADKMTRLSYNQNETPKIL